jgi:hypothetical protein
VESLTDAGYPGAGSSENESRTLIFIPGAKYRGVVGAGGKEGEATSPLGLILRDTGRHSRAPRKHLPFPEEAYPGIGQGNRDRHGAMPGANPIAVIARSVDAARRGRRSICWQWAVGSKAVAIIGLNYH